MAELSWEPSVNPANIGVTVKDAIVTLTGHVDSFPEKWNAEIATRRVAGVKALAVEMEVNLPGSSARKDADIAQSATNVLSWMSYLPADAVSVTCENGWLSLAGQVQWDYQRKAMSAAVSNLMGVTGVSNQVILKPGMSVALVKSDIEAALKRQAHIDAEHILVEINDNVVTLSGHVRSISEHDLAKQSVWRSPGVHNVIDHLRVD